MDYKKLLIISTIIFAVKAPGFAQLRPDVIAPSPEAASLGKYGEFPVSLYTGIPNIGIPIYTIQSRDVSLPISLSYHAGGVRVEEEASMVGLNWSLNYGGIITRVMKGGDDLQSVKQAYYNANGAGTIHYKGYPFDPLPEFVTQDDQTKLCQNELDPEPDLFYFNFFGTSGKFLLKKGQNVADNYIVGTSSEREKIDIVFNRSLLQWEIKTKDGFKYFFKTMELTQVHRNSTKDLFEPDPTPYYHNAEDMIVSAWYLDKIISPMGEEVNFVYDVVQEPTYKVDVSLYATAKTTYSENSTTMIKLGDSSPQNNSYCYSDHVFQHYKSVQRSNSSLIYPKEINFTGGKVVFQKSSRDDMEEIVPGNIYAPMNYFMSITPYIQPPQKIDAILFYNYKNELIKKVKLGYDYFNNHYTSKEDKARYKRLKLLSYQECGTVAQSSCNPPYKFYYDESSSLPSKIGYEQDFWGFYNGKSGNVSSIPLGVARDDASQPWKEFGSADRFPDKTYVQTGILKKIVYPTGGSTEFNYELNDYSVFGNNGFRYLADISTRQPLSATITENENGIIARSAGGVRIKEVLVDDGSGNKQSTQYSYKRNRATDQKLESTGRLMMLPNYHVFSQNYVFDDGCYAHYNSIEAASWSNVEMGSSASGGIVGYDAVEVSKTGNGFTRYEYLNEVEALTDNDMVVPGVPNITATSNGLLKSESYYANNDSQNPQKKIEYKYTSQLVNLLNGIAFCVVNHSGFTISSPVGNAEVETTCLNSQAIAEYRQRMDRWVLTEKTETDYSAGKSAKIITKYTYDELSHLQLKKEEVTFDAATTLTTEYTYPNEASWIPSQINDDFFLITPVEVTQTKAGVLVGKTRKHLAVKNAKPVLDYEEVFSTSGTVDKIQNYVYDTQGNVIQSNIEGDVPTAYVWGYHRTLCVAKVMNATASDIVGKINTTTLQDMDDQALEDELNKLRTALPNAQVYTYVHKPGIGITRATDPNGISAYYEYDLSGRLILVKDNSGDVLKHYRYEFGSK